MDEVARLLTLLALGGGALTILGIAFAWAFHEGRRVRGTLRKVLGEDPSLLLVARGRGRAVGLNASATKIAIVWDAGAWGLCYRIEELIGAELVVDRWVAARTHRGEVRRPLDQLAAPQERVRLRFLFDDPTYPDFDMDLWQPEDATRRDRFEADEALHEANRWVARLETAMRRNLGVRLSPTQLAVVAPPPPVFEDFGDEHEVAPDDHWRAVS